MVQIALTSLMIPHASFMAISRPVQKPSLTIPPSSYLYLSLARKLARDLRDDYGFVSKSPRRQGTRNHTVQRNDAEDKDQRENQDNDRIDLQSRGLIGIKSYKPVSKSILQFSTASISQSLKTPDSPYSHPIPTRTSFLFPSHISNIKDAIPYPSSANPSPTQTKQPGTLTQHSTAAPARTRRSRRARPHIRNLILLVRRRASTDRRLRPSRGSRGRGTPRRRAGRASGGVDGGGGAWGRLRRN